MSETVGQEVSERVLRHFPGCAAEVDALLQRDTPFRDMCLELMDAEKALAHLRSVLGPHREERVAECLGWIERLTVEMRAALAEARVVPLDRDARRGRA